MAGSNYWYLLNKQANKKTIPETLQLKLGCNWLNLEIITIFHFPMSPGNRHFPTLL